MIDAVTNSMTTVRPRNDFFSTLPPGVLGNVLHLLNCVTGDSKGRNPADLDVIFRNAFSLTLLSKTFYNKMRDPVTMNIFFTSLSEKYGKAPEEFAVLFNTRGSRAWLWSYIQKNEYPFIYKTIRDVYELTRNLFKEAQAAGLKFKMLDREMGPPLPSSFQTKSGFFFSIVGGPDVLATPFGQVSLPSIFYSEGPESASLSVAEALIQRLNATLAQIEVALPFETVQDHFYEMAASSYEPGKVRKIDFKQMQEISKEKALELIGKKNLVINVAGGKRSFYKMKNIGESNLTEAIWHTSSQDFRSWELITGMWEMLEAYRKKQDPFIPPKREKASPVKLEKPVFQNLNEVLPWAISLAERLTIQRSSPLERWGESEKRTLVLKNRWEAGTFEKLNECAQQFLPQGSGWNISSDSKSGSLTLSCSRSKNQSHGELSPLFEAYQKVLEALSQGWEESRFEKCPDLLHFKSEEDYVLFVKQRPPIISEACLIRCLVEPLGLPGSYFRCNDDWKNSDRRIYMWVKKEKVREVLDKLQITITVLQ